MEKKGRMRMQSRQWKKEKGGFKDQGDQFDQIKISRHGDQGENSKLSNRKIMRKKLKSNKNNGRFGINE